jgi:hypothetical protein
MPTGELIDFLKTWQPPTDTWSRLSRSIVSRDCIQKVAGQATDL